MSRTFELFSNDWERINCSLKPKICDFHSTSVSFLGFILEKGHFRTDLEKVQAVANWPTSTDHKQLQRFLGFANFYRRLIKDYSKIAAPLTQLTSSLRTFIWNPEAERAFGDLKARFVSEPVLNHPDPHKEFLVEVDASDVGVGAVLSQ